MIESRRLPFGATDMKFELEERKYRFALLPDGLHVAEFFSPHEMLPYQEGAGPEPLARTRTYSAILCPVKAVMGQSCGMEDGEAHYCLGVAQCSTYEQAYQGIDDYVRENNGFWITELHLPSAIQL
jgi:hypothetical protein